MSLVYALGSQAAEQGVLAVSRNDIDAVLLLGTGTPTLPAWPKLAQWPNRQIDRSIKRRMTRYRAQFAPKRRRVNYS
jgi:hypothetical protein